MAILKNQMVNHMNILYHVIYIYIPHKKNLDNDK